MDLSSTSPFNQHPGWTGLMLPLGLFPSHWNCSNCKFCITCSSLFLNSHSRQLVEGINVLRRVEEIATFNERPVLECKVAECGVLDFQGPKLHIYTSCDAWLLLLFIYFEFANIFIPKNAEFIFVIVVSIIWIKPCEHILCSSFARIEIYDASSAA